MSDSVFPSNPTFPFWLREPYRLPNIELSSVRDSNVIIIGAGLAGLSTAYWLTQFGVQNVIVLDARGVAGGATGRNGGHLWPCKADEDAFHHPPKEYVEKYGIDETRRLFQFDFDTVDAMLKFIKDNNIQCDLNQCGSISFAMNEKEAKDMENYMSELKKYGLDKGAEFWDAKKCKEMTFTSRFPAGLFQKYAASVWAAKFVFGLADVAQKAGVKIVAPVRVNEVVQKSDGKLEVRTNKGVVFANKVVHATNGYSGFHLNWLKDYLKPVRGQVLLTAPVSVQWPVNISWQSGLGYMIQRADKRILIGGMRQESRVPNRAIDNTNDAEVEKQITESILKFLKDSFPQIQDEIQIEQVWAGIMGFTLDGNPVVGPLPYSSNEYILAGFSGHGMPRCFGCAKVIAEMMLGKRNPENFLKPFDVKRYYNKSKL